MKIELTSKTPKAQIRYTMDGTAPTEASALYSEPFEIAGFPFTVRARAYADAVTPSRYTELAGKSPEEWEKVAGSLFNGGNCPINNRTVTNGDIIVTILNNKVYYSTNGFDWALVSQISNASYAGYTCGRFVVTTSKQIYTSADGINWQLATVTISEATLTETGGATLTYEIVGGNDARGFIACRQSYNVFFLLTSTDGINWVDTAGRFDYYATNIVYEKNILLVYCTNSYNVYRSVDNGQTFSLTYTFPYSGGIVFAGNYFYGLSSTKIFYSTDGETWTNISRTSVFARANVKYLNNKYFICEGYGVAVSDDGLNWRFHRLSDNQYFYYIEYINGVYVFGSGTSAELYTSTDGENWTALPNAPKFNSPMCHVAGKLWGTKGNGCYYTDDGYNWHVVGINGMDYIYEIAKGADGNYVINGGEYGTYFSRDLVNFTKISEIKGNGWAVIYAGGKYVASGTGTLYTSTDGENWATHTLSKSANIRHIAYCNNIFIATGESGLLATSTDGENWTVIDIGVTTEIGLVCYANGLYVTGATSKYVITSTDGINWTVQTFSTADYKGAFYANGKYYVYGSRGFIESADGINWVELPNGNGARSVINVGGIYVMLDTYGNNAYYGTDLNNSRNWTRLNFSNLPYTLYYRCLANVGDEVFIGGSNATLMKCELLKRSIEED